MRKFCFAGWLALVAVITCGVTVAAILLVSRRGSPRGGGFQPPFDSAPASQAEADPRDGNATRERWESFSVTGKSGTSVEVSILVGDAPEPVVDLMRSISIAQVSRDFSEERKAKLLSLFHETCADPKNLNAAPYHQLAIYLWFAGDLEKAQSFALAAIINYPTRIGNKTFAQARKRFEVLGHICHALGEHALAANAYKEAIAYTVLVTEEWKTYSHFLANAGEFEASLEAYRQYLAVTAGRGAWWAAEDREHEATPAYIEEAMQAILKKRFENGTFVPAWLPAEKAVNIQPRSE